MKLLAFLLVSLLWTACAVEGSCSQESRTVGTMSSSLVHCIQFKSTNCLACKSTRGQVVKCDTQPTEQRDPSKENGPIPDGLYSIGAVYNSGGIPWANMYPQKADKSGWWDYYRISPDTGRGYIALHPGTLSLGCVTVLGRSCWNQVEDMLKAAPGGTITVSRTLWRKSQVNRRGVLTSMQ